MGTEENEKECVTCDGVGNGLEEEGSELAFHSRSSAMVSIQFRASSLDRNLPTKVAESVSAGWVFVAKTSNSVSLNRLG